MNNVNGDEVKRFVARRGLLGAAHPMLQSPHAGIPVRMRLGRIGWIAMSAVCGGLLLPAVAFAHPLVDRGVRHYDDAEFEDALGAFERAEARADLTRDDLVLLFRTRALVHFAMGSTDAMESDLLRLVALDPEYDVGRGVPPRVRRSFNRIKRRVTEPIGLEVRVLPTEEGLRIEASVVGDEPGLTQNVRIEARTAGQRVYRTADGESLEIVAERDQTVEYVVSAIGPGGAVIVSEGFPDRPREVTPATAAESAQGVRTETRVRTFGSGDLQPPAVDDEGGSSAVWWILGGVAVAAAVVVTVLLLTLGGNEDTILLAPTGDLP
jgi:hypothetical protein